MFAMFPYALERSLELNLRGGEMSSSLWVPSPVTNNMLQCTRELLLTPIHHILKT